MNIKLKKFAHRASQASDLMKSLANAHRLMIVCRLREGSCCVGDLEAMIGLSQSALSQHLARLRKDGLVKTRRDAQTIYYSLANDKAEKLIREIYHLYCG